MAIVPSVRGPRAAAWEASLSQKSRICEMSLWNLGCRAGHGSDVVGCVLRNPGSVECACQMKYVQWVGAPESQACAMNACNVGCAVGSVLRDPGRVQ